MEVFEAIGDPVRRQILTALAGEGTLGAGEIAGRFAISRPAVSRHLRVLRESGVVRSELSGRRRLYRLAPDGLEPLRAWVVELAAAASDPSPTVEAAWSGRLDALETEVRRARRDHERVLAVEALAAVQVPDPEGRARAYPHQLSGGLRQRVMIAMAMACRPDLLIADEPTTALDVTVQAEVLRLIRELCEREGTAVLLISHDLGVIAQMCQRVGVMANGRLLELRDAKALFTDPRHPYTQGLLAALPRLGSRATEGRHRLADLDMAIDRNAPDFAETYLHPRGEAA